MSLKSKIEKEIRDHEKKIEDIEKAHRTRMQRARVELANLRRLLGLAEGIELTH